MEQATLKKMRIKQIAASNLIAGIMIVAFFILIKIYEIRFTHFFFCLGILMLLQKHFWFYQKRIDEVFYSTF